MCDLCLLLSSLPIYPSVGGSSQPHEPSFTEGFFLLKACPFGADSEFMSSTYNEIKTKPITDAVQIMLDWTLSLLWCHAIGILFEQTYQEQTKKQQKTEYFPWFSKLITKNLCRWEELIRVWVTHTSHWQKHFLKDDQLPLNCLNRWGWEY